MTTRVRTSPVTTDARTGRAALVVLAFASLPAWACHEAPTTPSSPTTSISAGHWSGTTAQGATIAFDVGPDERLVFLSIGFNFNGCAGLQSFSNLSLPTARDVGCSPGPCSDAITSARSFAYSSGRSTEGPSTTVFGLFFPGDKAQGTAAFQNFGGCGSATGVEWTATRR